MEVKFRQIIRNQEESFFTAIRTVLFGCGDFFFHVAPGFIYGLGQHPNILVRPLDIVKRRFGLMAHNRLSDRLQLPVALQLLLSVIHCRTIETGRKQVIW
jgi:hypothetical protein